jgi:hypothetical protein
MKKNRYLPTPTQSIHAHANSETQNIKSNENFYSKLSLSRLEMSIFYVSEIGEQQKLYSFFL